MTRARLAIAAAIAVLAGACAAGGGPNGPRSGPSGRLAANPSAVVAFEIAFNRLAQDKGRWAAFRETADDSAVMFVPQPVNARDWLKGRADPSATLTWQPHQVWISCDGTLAATKGAWQGGDGTNGYFTTVWKRQKDGSYKWVLDQGDTLSAPLQAPDMIAATVADCTRPAQQESAPPPAKDAGVANEATGASADGSMRYGYDVRDGSRRVFVAIRKDGALRDVITSRVETGPGK